MSQKKPVIRSISIGAYLVLAFAVLFWLAGNSYFCARSPLSTFRLSLACCVWDLFACAAGSWVAQKVTHLRTVAPLIACLITGTGLASIPFWLYRGYGHWLLEGTPTGVSCVFAEGYGMVFPFVVAPALGLPTLMHSILWLRTSKGS